MSRRAGAVTPAQVAGLLLLRSVGGAPRCDARRWQIWGSLPLPVRRALIVAHVVVDVARGVTLTRRGVADVEVARAALRLRRQQDRREQARRPFGWRRSSTLDAGDDD